MAHQLFSIAELLYADTRLNNVIFKFEAKKKLNPRRIKLETAYKNKETTAVKIEF
ncbi:hypothetical protein N5D11_11385 [Acinetobacter johnsonii]|uniref:Uncharacterized protein n=1 Tax=Acinetobacter johnsonii TaxID=40214 RepID=A0AA42LF30_ACIJO|nr:hypothetical protein [Acinetobacter johnsonii]MDH0656714.1 hypothetical protein [Acinetobacter johnsonii]